MRRRRSSANRVLTILKAALNHAFNDGSFLGRGMAESEAIPVVDAARIHYLTVTEARRLINACEPGLRPLVQAALQTGARYGELASLKVHDFNADAGTVAIRQSKAGTPRHAVLTDEGAALFAHWTAGRAGSEPLLLRPGGEPWRASHQGRPMREACERAKIVPALSFHGLRHTWASLAVMAGMPLLVVARNPRPRGHANGGAPLRPSRAKLRSRRHSRRRPEIWHAPAHQRGDPLKSGGGLHGHQERLARPGLVGLFEHVRRTVQPDQSGKLTALEAELVDEIRTRRAQLFTRASSFD